MNEKRQIHSLRCKGGKLNLQRTLINLDVSDPLAKAILAVGEVTQEKYGAEY